jgi:hypothetical protein
MTINMVLASRGELRRVTTQLPGSLGSSSSPTGEAVTPMLFAGVMRRRGTPAESAPRLGIQISSITMWIAR